MGMIERAQSAFDEIIKAMGEKDSQLLKREPEVRKLVVEIVRKVEKAREPESWPVESYPDHYKEHPADHDLWVRLLMKASLRDENFASILSYLRDTGCILEQSDRYGYIIKPVIGDKGWTSKAEYDREKKPLGEYQDLLLELLRTLGNEDMK